MDKKACTVTKPVIGLALLLSCIFQAACARGVDERADVRAALERYRDEVDALHPAPRGGADPDHAFFADALRLVLNTYVTPSDPHALVGPAIEGFRARSAVDPGASRRVLTEAAIDGMLASLDAYSAFLDAEHVRDLREEIQGHLAAVPGEKPAARTGNARKPSRFRPVSYRLEDDVAYIRIRQFDERTGPQVNDAVASMRRQSRGRLAGAVLDLRDNPGGLLEQGVKVAEPFLGAEEIVSTRGHGVGTRHYFADPSRDLMSGLPVAVLINGRTASAAEIVAGALQDHHRAVLFGTRSFGKGSVQTVYWLPGGEAVRLTTARYFRPSGASVDCVGIAPDVEVTPGPSAGARLRNGDDGAPHPVPLPCSAGMAPQPAQAWSMAALCPDISQTVPDRPLQCAIAAIRTKRLSASVRARAAE